MNSGELVAKLGIYGGSFVVGFVSGLVPFVNVELYLVAISPVASREALIPIAVLSAIGQMLAKTILFYAGRGVFKIRLRKIEKKIETVQQKFQEWKGKTDLLIFLSALVGFPPLYATSVVAGAMKLSYPKFLAVGVVGRCIRFAVIVSFPQLVLRYI